MAQPTQPDITVGHDWQDVTSPFAAGETVVIQNKGHHNVLIYTGPDMPPDSWSGTKILPDQMAAMTIAGKLWAKAQHGTMLNISGAG